MNPVEEFLFFNPDVIADIDSSFLQGILAILAIVHSIAWLFVLFLLPFKLLSWITSNKKK